MLTPQWTERPSWILAALASRPRGPFGALAFALLLGAGCADPEPAVEAGPAHVEPDPLRVAEDLRGEGPQGIGPLLDGLRDPSGERRVRAVRGLGRLERPELGDTIRTAFFDTDPRVRREAANALAQAVRTDDSASARAREWLNEGIATEQETVVLGAYARALARLPASDAVADSVEAVLASVGGRLASAGDTEALVELALGLERFFRSRPDREAGPAGETLGLLAGWGRPSAGARAANEGERVAARRVRSLTTGLLGRLPDGAGSIDAALSDPDPSVRRVALRARAQGARTGLDEVLSVAIGDPDATVRIEALRQWESQMKSSRGCEPLLFAVRDGSPHVAMTALTLLARRCPEAARQGTTLQAVAAGVSERDWQLPALAMFALARVAPERGRLEVARFTAHPSPFARAWAARAAGVLGDVERLALLAADADPNVRTAALRAWFDVEGHTADSAAAAQLGADDPQLVLTAAGLLEGSPRGPHLRASLVDALERLTERGEDVLRDPRVALVRRIGEFSDSTDVGVLEPYLTDPDSVVARSAAEAITVARGTAVAARPSGNPDPRMPTEPEIEALERTRVLLDFAGRGRIGIRLYADVAPSNVARFVELVESGGLVGLTLHRIEPNFVLQGGSPGANEYAGHGHYTRDELGSLSHWRGTVGLSTRGRDTADGQIFINLVDNPRLDHDYTIIGHVELGLDVADRILEGDWIESASVVRSGSEDTAPSSMETGSPSGP